MTGRIGQQEIESLPRASQLRLAARCVRRARAMLGPAGKAGRTLDAVLDRLDEASRAQRFDDRLTDAAAAAYTLALDHVDHREPGDEDQAVVTCLVAHAAAFAAEAATLPDAERCTRLVAQSLDFAVHACRLRGGANADSATDAMRGDLERIEANAVLEPL